MKVTRNLKSNVSMPQQSPVNLVKSESYHVKTPRGFFKLDYKDSPYSGTFEGENNYSNFQLYSVIGKRPPILQIGSVFAELKKIHLHTPSEHDFEGNNRAGEVHLIHEVKGANFSNGASKSSLVVVGVSFTANKHAAENSFIKTWASCMRSSITKSTDSEKFLIDPRRLLPKTKKWYRYEGSLTTGTGDLYPEIVSWIVMADPIDVCNADLKLLQKYAHQHERCVQDINRRFILRNFE
jgi:carbonic anhydrase